eukprot:CAMPEP_0167828560 /NCGR_PEP_ID=MMETSP0112_2-20121227/11510_1 /TAXON_ID=91324 /ORGANISM="Lotharella globosa, Strain CCCM811" /LENGTH=113 /DNA_ID=CAMNT_0007731833 /DNA_START=281 /DNA_END=622 /DNA_ORIENTATION=+
MRAQPHDENETDLSSAAATQKYPVSKAAFKRFEENQRQSKAVVRKLDTAIVLFCIIGPVVVTLSYLEARARLARISEWVDMDTGTTPNFGDIGFVVFNAFMIAYAGGPWCECG